jgi:hypothetical protein
MLLRWFVAASLALGAHEIGTTRVKAEFPADGTYVVEIDTDAAPLLEKLAARTGRTGGLGSYDEAFRGRVSLAFDSAETRPAIAYSLLADTGASVKLTGSVPQGAKAFTFQFGWVFTTYSLQTGGTTVWVEGGQTSAPLPVGVTAPVSSWRVAGQYLALGFTHIVPYGLDHVLFVLGIYLLSNKGRSVFLQVTAFTLAHSITLGLSMYGVLRAPASIVEPLIAVSIAYVAIENLFLSELRPWRLGLVFGFGLLHGLGFAGVLTELGLPRGEFVTALLTFNAGVELGQMAVIAVAFLLVGWHFASRVWYRNRVVIPASMLIACTAVYWTVERVIGN